MRSNYSFDVVRLAEPGMLGRMSRLEPVAPLRPSLVLLACLASSVLFVHIVLGNGYGFHRDELQFLDDARHLQFGFVAYPPLTALCGRIAIALFGISVQVFRLPAAITNAVSLVVVGLIARELGGSRVTQAMALLLSLAVALAFSSVLQYNTFDYLAWALAALFTARLLRTEDERNWVGIGAAIGLGVLAKYSIGMLAVSLVAGFALLPDQRRHLRSKWFVLGIVAMLVVAGPNLIWLASHHFITLQMEHFIHARDVGLGRANGYFTDQIKFTMLALPIVVFGLVFLFRNERFRPLAFFFLGPFVLFALVRGRGYYLLPAYIPLNAAGAVALERWANARSRSVRLQVRTAALAAALLNMTMIGAVFLPLAKPGSAYFAWQMRTNEDLADEVGWPEFVDQIAAVWETLPAEERGRAAILAENYGAAGALALYGPGHGLPTPISEVNSFYGRGYGPYPPETLIVSGGEYEGLAPLFESCRLVGLVQMPYGVTNGETTYGRNLFVCRHPRQPWAVLWAGRQHFG